MRVDSPPSPPVCPTLTEVQTWLEAIHYLSKSPPATRTQTLSQLQNKKLSPQQEFFRKYAPYALYTQRLTGIPASVTLAQAALESGWGHHSPGNNFFGIKGKGPAGSQMLWTREFKGGGLVRVRAKFRRYETPLQSFLDHARVISHGRYLRHAMAHTQSAKSFVTALQSGKYKYATDPQYTRKVLGLIQSYHLDRLDS